MRKKVLLLLVIVMSALVFAAGCSGGSSSNEAADSPDAEATAETSADDSEAASDSELIGSGKTVGITLPSKDMQRWIQDGDYLKAALENEGFTVDLQYAGNQEVPLQIQQVEQFAAAGYDYVVIAAIDSSQVASAAEQAKEAGATIIGYDRNILNTEAIDYYVTFDNYKVGELQAQYVIDQLDLANNSGPFNIELISGDSADSNFHFFVGGALDTLKPYLDEGVLAIPSGRNTEAKIATGYWGNESGQKRMEDLIVSEKYGPNGTPLAAVVSTDDPLAQGISSALRDDGYTPEDFPLLTGMNADIASVKNIIAGYQSMTIFKDTREAAQKTADGIVAFAKGETPEINETKEYNNGVKDVDTYLCTPVVVTKDNYQEMLVDSGYYTEDDLS